MDFLSTVSNNRWLTGRSVAPPTLSFTWSLPCCLFTFSPFLTLICLCVCLFFPSQLHSERSRGMDVTTGVSTVTDRRSPRRQRGGAWRRSSTATTGRLILYTFVLRNWICVCKKKLHFFLVSLFFTQCNLLLLLAKIMDARSINSQIIQLSLVTGQPETQNSYLSPSSEHTMLTHYQQYSLVRKVLLSEKVNYFHN